MKNVILVLLTIIACEIYASAQTKVTALSILTESEPTVKWNAKSEIKGDFDYDGVTDYALRGIKEKSFVLGIVKGALNRKSKHWTMKFGEDAADQSALCSVDTAIITNVSLDKTYAADAADYLNSNLIKALLRLSASSKGITVSDGKCDSFNILWDKQGKLFFWWRI